MKEEQIIKSILEKLSRIKNKEGDIKEFVRKEIPLLKDFSNENIGKILKRLFLGGTKEELSNDLDLSEKDIEKILNEFEKLGWVDKE